MTDEDERDLWWIDHPDPDDAAYLQRIGRLGEGIHGCDGCCRP